MEDSTTANWDGRLRSIQVRLAMAARVSNSIVGKVKILNAIMLPAVLFTAQFVKPPEATVKRLVNLQKLFLWKGQLRADGTKHKINPELLFSPVSQGGVGLQAIPLAIKRQAMRRATQWLLADRTIFTEAWHSLAHRDKAQTVSCCTISPRVYTPKLRAKRYRSSTTQQLGVDFICDHLVESNPKPDQWKHHASTAVQRAMQAALLLWDEDGSPYLQLDAGEPQVHQTSFSHETARFRPTYKWSDNAWIVDSSGKSPAVKDVPFLRDCKIAELNIRRRAQDEWSFKIPAYGVRWTYKRLEKLRRWITSIVLCSPPIEVGDTMHLSSALLLWNTVNLSTQYEWKTNGLGMAIGYPIIGGKTGQYIDLLREPNGITWKVIGNSTDAQIVADVQKLTVECQLRGSTFKPHPLSSRLQWRIPERTQPNRVREAMDRARTRPLRRTNARKCQATVRKLEDAACPTDWHYHLQQRTVAEVWSHQGSLTTYQLWVSYRMVTLQLNLFHPGRVQSADCPVDAGCGRTKETIEHIMWECNRAKAVWSHFCQQWLGETLDPATGSAVWSKLLPHIATRKSPPTSARIVRSIQEQFGFYTPEHATALERIWFTVCTVIPSALWQLRNATVHERTMIQPEACRSRVWKACTRQLNALSSRLLKHISSQIEGICHRQCIAVLETAVQKRAAQVWRQARLYFDGGARGNPGPGGSGWALVTIQPTTQEWEPRQCGYKYQGASQTNNFCEYEAVKDGLAHAWTELQQTDTALEVYGDSNMIIQQQKGFPKVKSQTLAPSAQRVHELSEKFKWITWIHVRREYNKMADTLANLAMNSKGNEILTQETLGPGKQRFELVAHQLQNDLQGENDLCDRSHNLIASLATGIS